MLEIILLSEHMNLEAKYIEKLNSEMNKWKQNEGPKLIWAKGPKTDGPAGDSVQPHRPLSPTRLGCRPSSLWVGR